ncbi:MAG: SDR family oxidoreductase [Bacteroidia bacterium]|jgi:3-oxoacyl-[acyl-carrier protein] reductase|nr:SDR family oxidoreductase [Bacteroidia bacterium]
MKTYAEIQVGQKETLHHIITSEDISKFVELTGDDNRLHVDEKFASTTPFKKPVVHGMLGASFISTIIGTKLPGDGALWFSQSLEFLLPVRVGDELTITAEVLKKHDKEQIIELKTEIHNQNKQLVTKGLAKVKVIATEKPETQTAKIEAPQRVALVIGGTGGIGMATCLQLAKDGFDLIVHYNKNKEKAEAIKTQIESLGRKALCIQSNITDDKEIQHMVEKGLRNFGRIDVLAHCAASVIPNIKFQDLTWSDYTKQFELNIKSSLSLIQALAPGMIQEGYGKIIHIGSLAADKPNADWSAYITAKSALEGLTKSLAFELAPKGIRINMVSPSLVSTELTADVPEKIKLMTAAQTPLRRLALAEDVAGVISFLASSKSDFLTGENIRLNGGQIMY